MPIYEYRCQGCQHEMEAMQKITEDALTHCPMCGKDQLTKLISRSSFHLKGSGWYETDFKKSPLSKTETDKVETSAENKPSTTKTETTTTATPATTPTTTTSVSSTEAA